MNGWNIQGETSLHPNDVSEAIHTCLMHYNLPLEVVECYHDFPHATSSTMQKYIGSHLNWWQWMVEISKEGKHYILNMYLKQYIWVWCRLSPIGSGGMYYHDFTHATSSTMQKYIGCHFNRWQWTVVISKEGNH
jgi:hypothetical protein